MVDDHLLFRKTLRSFLLEQKDLIVVVQSSNLFDLRKELKTNSVDLLIMDLFMPSPSGREAIVSLREEYPAVKILVLSMYTDMEMISELQDCGIHGFISKSDEPEELLQAIRAIADNRLYRNKLFTEALYCKQNTVSELRSGSQPVLNEREKKILQLIWEEKSNKEIADELFLGVRSVEKIRQDMKEKIGVKSTVGLLKYAIRKKIIETQLQSSAPALQGRVGQ
jgi:DNA-binding NarL/FixJ family response regulator